MKPSLWAAALFSCLPLVYGLYEDVPDCALPCLFEPLDYTPCEFTNSTCLCNDMNYNMAVIHCVRVQCSVQQALITKNSTWTDCGFTFHDEGSTIQWVPAFLFAVVTLFYGMRLATKWISLATWGWDDWTISFAYLMMIAFLVATFLAKKEGIGRDIWTLEVGQITNFIRGFFAFEIVYSITLAVIKASILFLYLRIFGAITETFRQILWATQIFNVAVCLTFVIVNVNQCKPLSYFWHGWDGRHPGYCIDLSAMALSHASLNIAIDVWMLVLPATQIYKLNLQKRQKAGIMSMFGVGIFITIVSAVRLKSVSVFSHSWNPTYDFYGLALWSHIELCVGMIVACMPAARALTRRLFPELLYVTNISSTRGSTRASGNVKIVSQDIATIATDDVPESSSSKSKKDSLASLTPDRVPLRRLPTSDSLMEISPSEPGDRSLFDGSNRGSKFSDW
ncbi:Satratoxin biosynthesis SC1 cluster protein 4 [Colletotrichum sidae]|uniref:Satratoxin biosynthesis SC1 cluster protein 4 n=2 Tax=Colletotrichum orbiculare species complex TaxID=2707354 RepID=A0A4R8QTM0_9PEZI|nr:Satratoxin biosynthesis SC1 cluster protein 4 [Colletotrichum spinosum]TDZ83719.1 Satratoxin biosynthesis SC1 cluster protein 4 [Colletotrichum sidae]